MPQFKRRYMNYRFTVKKLGDNWYLDIKHDSPFDILLDSKIGHCLSRIDKSKSGQLRFTLYEIHSIIDDNTIYMEEEDIVRYLTTNDDFDIHFWILDHEFSISSDLYSLLEDQYNLNLHKTMYTIEICDI